MAGRSGLEFGLKLSNTFPVDVKHNELPSEEMYMAGRSLFPLTIEMARRISAEFGGKLRLNLLRRAAVEGGDGDAAGDPGTDGVDKGCLFGEHGLQYPLALLENGRRLHQPALHPGGG